MEFYIYLLKSSALILLFFLFYFLVLKNDTYYHFKRQYFIAGLVTSVLLPLLTYSKTVNTSATNTFSSAAITDSTELPAQTDVLSPNALPWEEILFYLYIVVAAVLLIKLIYKYVKLYLKLSKAYYKKMLYAKVHVVDENLSPFSFFRHIVIGKEDYESDESKMILTHEMQHVRKGHYIDVLLLNLFCVAFWFHPVIWLYKKLAIQNLENQADNLSLRQVEDKTKYQFLLVNSSIETSAIQPIQSNIFQPSLKQRIMMMNKTNTRNIYALKSLILLPVLAFLFMSFQSRLVYKESFDTKTVTTNYKDSLNLKKNSRVIVKFTKEADRDYLMDIKGFLKKKYNIDINYSNIEFRNDQLAGLKVVVKSNDGFSGNIYSSNFTADEGIYLFRDYRNYVVMPFGIGKLPLPQFNDAKREDKSDRISMKSQFIFSPSRKENTNNQNTVPSKTKVATSNTSSFQEKLARISQFIIKGKSYLKADLEQKKVIFQKFEFLDNKTLRIEGDIVNKKELQKSINTALDDVKDVNVKDIQTIFFLKNQDPFLVKIDKLEVNDEKD